MGVEKTCKDCLFWREHVTVKGRGDCLRFPPSVVANDKMMFPATGFCDWCGEWKENENALLDDSIAFENFVRARFSTRARGILWRSRIVTFRQLLHIGYCGFLDLRNAGEITAEHVKSELKRFGLELQ